MRAPAAACADSVLTLTVGGFLLVIKRVPTQQRIYAVCADAVLILHFAFAVFVVGGLALIWAGWFFGWSFVRNFHFRLAHVAAMGLVVSQALFDIACPLTIWEEDLRLLAGGVSPYEGECVRYWVHRLLFCDCGKATFTMLYILFFLLMLLSLWMVPPRWPEWRLRRH